MGRERAAAPLHLLRPDQPGAGRQPGDLHQLALAAPSARRPPRTRISSTAPTSPRRSTGAAWPWPNTDAIEEVQVLSLGASAEYGNVQGAVFNVVTRQGSNEFHGDGNFYFQNQSLTGRNTDRRAGRRASRTTATSSRTRPWQLGGPDQEGQALVLRLVPVPEGLRVAARHAAGVPGAVVGQARLRQVELPVQPRTTRLSSSTTTTSTGFPAARPR